MSSTLHRLTRSRPYPLPNAPHAFLLEHHGTRNVNHPYLVFPNYIPPRFLS